MVSDFGEGALLGGRYRLERVLGTGGMASVWLAHDERLGRPVALKLLSDTLAHDEAYLSRFRREARLAASLSHPNLVDVYDYGGESERPYLVMEYIEGETLADRIAAGTVGELDATRLARELLGALEHIHTARIVHRDMKPGNVLIGPDGGASVTDFGIARPDNATRLTSTGLVIGTRDYMAPEVLRGEPATVRSDLYSCAMMLGEALGEPPPPGLAGFLDTLAEEDPYRRPASASEALAMLAPVATAPDATATEALPTEPLQSERTAPTVPIGTGATWNRPDARLVGGLALLTLLAVLGIVLLGGGDQGPAGGRDAQRPANGERVTTSPAEEPAASQTTTTTEASEPAPVKPEKAKPPKPPKSPPGKAKGLSKH